jgi:hypothetical protein
MKLLTQAAYELALGEGVQLKNLIEKVNAISVAKDKVYMHTTKTFAIWSSFNKAKFFDEVFASTKNYDKLPTALATADLPTLVYGEEAWHETFGVFRTDEAGKTFALPGSPLSKVEREKVIDKMILMANFVKSNEFKEKMASKAVEWNLPNLVTLVKSKNF